MTFQQQRAFPQFFHPNGYYYDDESRYTATICAERVLDDDKPATKRFLWTRAELNNLIVPKLSSSEQYQAKWWYYYHFYMNYMQIFGTFNYSAPRSCASYSALPSSKQFINRSCINYSRYGRCQIRQKCPFSHR